MNKYKKIKRKDGTTVDEHRVIAKVEFAGRDVVVHHIDGDKSNNSPDNLQVMSRSEHAKLHGLGSVIRPTEPFSVNENGEAKCRKCNQTKPIESFSKNKNYKCGYLSVCKLCRNKYRRDKHKENKK